MPSNLSVPVGQYLANLNLRLPHHMAWLQAALERLVALEPGALDRDGELYGIWQAASSDGPSPPQGDAFGVSGLALMRAAALIRSFEGLVLLAYPDPDSGGEPWAVGYGCTRHDDGRPVRPGDRVTIPQAFQMLQRQLARDFAQVLAETVPHFLEMNVNQQAALLSFAWNCGAGFYGAEGYETITKLLRDRHYYNVPEAMLLYVNPGSEVEAGLIRRRRAEGQLWLTSA